MESNIISDELRNLFSLVVFPGGCFLILLGLSYEWVDRKLLARFQNRIGPRWFQPFADILKLLAKEEVVPEGVDRRLFIGLPIVALTGALTAGLYLPILGAKTNFGFPGDLIVTLYMLSLLTLCMGLAGANTLDRFSLIGATRTLTQLFSYESPFLLALLGPALFSNSWQISEIIAYADGRWLILTQPIGFLVAMIALMGKLELPPFDAPEAETEIVAGALTEYSGRGLALFRLGKGVELVIGLTLVSTLYLGGIANPLTFFLKTLALLLIIVVLQALLTRLRIDQTVGLWWRYGSLLVLLQWLILILLQGSTT
jgi:NADH-quinone oxidoreductase subunit H